MKSRSAVLLSIAVAAVASLASCKTGGGGSAPSSAGGGDTLSAQGKKLYYGRCTACHAPEPVRDYSLAEWHALMPEMAEESNLNPVQESALRAYVESFF